MIPGERIIRLLGFLVPAPLRHEWLREWYGELHSVWGLDGVRRRARFSAYLRCLGALEDAFWLRVRWRERRMIMQDLRYSFRTFRRAPFFPAVVVITLALGIGANTAIFSLVDTVLLKPIPVAEPEALTDIWTTCRLGYQYCSSSYPDFLDYRRQNSSFTDIALSTPADLSLTSDDRARMADVRLVSGNYFTMLGIGAAAGRLIVPGDDALGNPTTALVLSHRVWLRDYGGDPRVIGRTVRLNGVPFTIVGVAPRRFRGTRLGAAPDAWVPITTTPLIVNGEPGSTTSQAGPPEDRLADRDARWISDLVARRRPGVTVEQARGDMIAVSDRLREDYPSRGPRSVTVEATRTMTLPANSRDDIVRFVWLLMAVVASALVIACANIANLFLARGGARQKEMALRLALGAGRSRVIRQLLTESLILAAAGGAVGVAVAYAALDLISGFALPGFVSIAALEPTVDTRVLAFTATVAIATGLAFGLAPAARASRQDLTSTLKDSADARHPSGYGTRAILLTIQTALASLLLIGAGLFVRSLQHGLATDVGFETRRLAMLGYDLSIARYDVGQARAFLRELTARAERTPGVTSVTSTVWPPLAQGGSGFFVNIDGYQRAPDEEIRIEANWVGAGFLTVMGIPLRSGRDIETGDRDGAPRVAVINETMARKYWPGVDAVGRTFHMGRDGSGPQVTIVGVARDVMDGLTQPPQPFIYYAMEQALDQALRRSFYLLAQTDVPSSSVLPSLTREMEQLDTRIPVAERTTLENRFAEYLMPQRMGSFLLTTFGGLTVLLSVIGIAGVVTFGVTRRRKEIGIRMALGAARAHVLRTVTRGALVPVGIGVATGLAAAVGISRFAQAFLFDVTPTDPITYVAVGSIMSTIAIVAAYLPARRATAVNPTEALRSE